MKIVFNKETKIFSVNYLPGFDKNRTLRNFFYEEMDPNGGTDPEYTTLYVLTQYILGDVKYQYDIIKSIDPKLESEVNDSFDDPLVIDNIKPNKLNIKTPELKSLCSKITNKYNELLKSKIDISNGESIGDSITNVNLGSNITAQVYHDIDDIKLVVISRREFINSIR